MSSRVVSLCDLTGNMVKPWAEAGYECVCYDLQHSIRADRVEGRITYRWANVRSLTPEDIRPAAIVFAFPPCTHLAVSGARDFQRKGLRFFIDALEIVESSRLLCEYSDAPWMLENPVGRLSSSWRDPDHTFDPCDYGDPYTKKTCLWVGGGFVMPPQVARGTGDRSNRRSETPMGFARAVFEANHPIAMRRVA